MLEKPVCMGNLSTGRRVRRVGPSEMVELNDESSQMERARNARILGPGKWSGGTVTVTGTPAIRNLYRAQTIWLRILITMPQASARALKHELTVVQGGKSSGN